MALHKVAVAAKDGATSPAAIPGGIQQHDTSGTGAGPNDPLVILVDSTGNEILGTTADAAATTSDATPISFMSVFKQISKSIQAAAASLATLVSDGATATAAEQALQLVQETAINTVLGTTAGTAVVTDAVGTVQQYLRGLVKLIAAGINVAITNANANITAIAGGTVAAGTAGAPVVGADQYGAYKAAAASATTVLGATGAVGDYLAGVIIVPGAAAAGTVGVTDGNGAPISLFAGGGTTALPDLRPFFVPLGVFAVNATTPGWRLILGASVTAIGVGKFT